MQFLQVRTECDRFGMPMIVWAYPRGAAIEAKGGRDSIYAVDYAARVACELGADIVKVNVPSNEEQTETRPKPYNTSALRRGRCRPQDRAVRRPHDGALLRRQQDGRRRPAEQGPPGMEQGATGLIFGRNMWQRHHTEALRMTDRIKQMMANYSG